jgi:hypothetical protein
VHNTELARKTSAQGLIDGSMVSTQGYEGSREFFGVEGLFNEINDRDFTSAMPWYRDLYQTHVVKDVGAASGRVTCTQYRDFRTKYSSIDLYDWKVLTGRFGFKVYDKKEQLVPFPKGYVKNFDLMVVDSAVSLVAAVGLGTVFLSLF